MRSFLAAACAVCCVPVFAQPITYYPNSAQLQVPVTATVGAACGFAPSAVPQGTFNVGEVDDGFLQDVPFTLQCTVPFRMGVISANGGLLASGTPPAGYTALAPYIVALHIVGPTLTSDASCDAAALKIGSPASCGMRGTASSTQGVLHAEASYEISGSYVRVAAPVYADTDILIAANDYADTLIVTLSAAP